MAPVRTHPTPLANICLQSEAHKAAVAHIFRRYYPRSPTSPISNISYYARRSTPPSSKPSSKPADLGALLSSTFLQDDILVPTVPAVPNAPSSTSYDGVRARPRRLDRAWYKVKERLRDHGWSEEEFDNLKEFVLTFATKNLKMGVAFRDVPLESKESLHLNAIKQFPALEEFDDHWPTADVLQMHLSAIRSKERVRIPKPYDMMGRKGGVLKKTT
ncbi:hypothetical protein SISNIDRAFT_468384 [Sistotremastrum niveocremeum HHB9708]|uniref:Uncharacterized protein n=1 Tax=Sistotremastrum niveocremeum HHB9708 TaxID=1314777 RepID=A0A164RJ88_9AGAM|nr:hypothetical protein SISNIDRAFT_468384 [Sistotremastrum niveocremeum HHB9708]